MHAIKFTVFETGEFDLSHIASMNGFTISAIPHYFMIRNWQNAGQIGAAIAAWSQNPELPFFDDQVGRECCAEADRAWRARG